jgi:hypothetical protein
LAAAAAAVPAVLAAATAVPACELLAACADTALLDDAAGWLELDPRPKKLVMHRWLAGSSSVFFFLGAILSFAVYDQPIAIESVACMSC